MKIQLEGIGKKYNKVWIFRNINFSFHTGQSMALLGPNGSGKSTLMKIISGYLIPSEGKVEYISPAGEATDQNTIYKYVSYSAPYLDLLEEFTVEEQITFHQHFMPFQKNRDTVDIISILGFAAHRDKQIRDLSSGMKQRMKLVLAILSDTPVLLLDEPATNLDAQGVAWYRDLISQYASNRLTIIASNRADEYDFCEEELNIEQFKN